MLRIVLPIVWAIVAAVIGWFLYRYSTAKFETKWVLFTGAAAIAAGCFYGLYRATPRSFTECVATGERVVREPDIARLRDLARELPDRLDAVRTACTSNPRRDDRCFAELDTLEERGVGIAGELRGLAAR